MFFGGKKETTEPKIGFWTTAKGSAKVKDWIYPVSCSLGIMNDWDYPPNHDDIIKYHYWKRIHKKDIVLKEITPYYRSRLLGNLGEEESENRGIVIFKNSMS